MLKASYWFSHPSCVKPIEHTETDQGQWRVWGKLKGRRGESFCLLPVPAGRCSKSVLLRIDSRTKFSPPPQHQEMQEKNIERKQQVTYHMDCDFWCQNNAEDVLKGERPWRRSPDIRPCDTVPTVDKQFGLRYGTDSGCVTFLLLVNPWHSSFLLPVLPSLALPCLLSQSNFWQENKHSQARTSSSESAAFCAPLNKWLQRLHSTKQ